MADLKIKKYPKKQDFDQIESDQGCLIFKPTYTEEISFFDDSPILSSIKSDNEDGEDD